MAMKRRILILMSMIFVLMCISGLGVFADSSEPLEGSPGQTVVVTFTCENLVGLDGVFTYSNKEIFSSIDVKVKGLTAMYNPESGMVSGYNATIADAIVEITFVLSDTAQVGQTCDITFKYEFTSDGYYPPEPEYHFQYATINVIKSVDYSRLRSQIAIAEKLVETDYTVTSWDRFMNALMDAYDALKSNKQKIVDDAADNLEEAIKGLVKYSVDYSELNKQIKLAEDLNEDDYTVASWTDLEEALKNAKAALSSRNQNTVNNAAKALENARKALVKKAAPVEIDYSELRRQISIAEALDENEYTKASWTKLETALTAAKKALKSTSQTEVNKAASSLKSAISGLVRDSAAVDYSELNKQIAIAEGLDEGDYTLESWAALQIKLENAKNALKSDKQSAVDTAAIELKNAIATLVKIDYTALIDAIEAVQKLSETNELADLWMQMHELLNRAQSLLTSRDQKAIDSLAAEIIKLLAEITEKMKETGNSIVEVEKPIFVDPKGDYCNVGTHRIWQILFWISFVINLAVIGLIVAFLYSKRRKVTDDTPLVDYDITDDFVD